MTHMSGNLMNSCAAHGMWLPSQFRREMKRMRSHRRCLGSLSPDRPFPGSPIPDVLAELLFNRRSIGSEK